MYAVTLSANEIFHNIQRTISTGERRSIYIKLLRFENGLRDTHLNSARIKLARTRKTPLLANEKNATFNKSINEQ